MSTLKVNNLQDLGADAVVTNGVVNAGALPAGSILQVVSTTKTDTFATTSGTYVDVTGLSATITPSSTSSKILVFVESYAGHSTNTVTSIALLRDSTIINSADGFNYYHRSNFGVDANAREINYAISVNFLDAPATTSATTYKLQIRTDAGTAYINRAGVASTVATVSSITLMEVAG